MTDLDTQLRACLLRHADHAAADPLLAGAVADRSRQLARHRPVMAVAAVVPIVAAIVVGAVALGSGSPAAAPQTVHIAPAASATATPATSPTASRAQRLQDELKVCPGGHEPNVHVFVTRPGTHLNMLSTNPRALSHGAVAIVLGYAIDGHRVPTKSRRLLIEQAIGPHRHRWQVWTKGTDSHQLLSNAKLVSCVRAK